MNRLPFSRGLTLLELLVAFAIMALSLGVLYRSMGGAARSAEELDGHQQAVILAQSLLSMRDSVADGGWHQRGQSGAYSWQIASAPFSANFSAPQVPLLYEVLVQISWEKGGRPRTFELYTLRPQRRPVTVSQ